MGSGVWSTRFSTVRSFVVSHQGLRMLEAIWPRQELVASAWPYKIARSTAASSTTASFAPASKDVQMASLCQTMVLSSVLGSSILAPASSIFKQHLNDIPMAAVFHDSDAQRPRASRLAQNCQGSFPFNQIQNCQDTGEESYLPSGN